jgi:hypothetical protein
MRHVEIGFDIADDANEFVFRSDDSFGALALLENGLSLLLIVPEAGVVDFGVERFQQVATRGNVKDNSARDRCAS